MPNSYTVVPNILPGNVSIGGNLTVGGDFIRIGAASPFFRAGKTQGGAGFISQNQANDQSTRDDGAQPAMDLVLDHAANTYRLDRRNNAGNLQQPALEFPVLVDYTTHGHTGTTTEDTIYSKVIRANMIGANGGLYMRMHFVNQTQAAGAPTLRVKLGAGLTVAFTVFTAGRRYFVDVYLFNVNSAASNLLQGLKTNTTDGTVEPANQGGAVDTSLDQTIAVTMQSGSAGDNQNFEMVVMKLMNSFGPV